MPSKAVTCSPGRRSTPFERWMAPISPPTSPPRTRSSGDLVGEDRGHLDAELSQRGRDLAADESRAHDDCAPARHRLLLDRVALSFGPEVVDSGQAGARDLELPVAPAGRDQDLVISELLVRVQGHRVRGGIDGHDAGAAAELDVVIGVPAGRSYVPAVEILLGPQVGLGQRRAAEGDARFPADEHHRSRETLLPDGGGGVAARHAAADDHDRVPAGSLRHAVHSASRSGNARRCRRR